MSRDLDPDLEDAIAEPVVRPFIAIKIDLPDPVYVWTGRGDLIFLDADAVSHTWQGAGDLGSIDTIGESSDGSATGIRATLNQIPSEFAADIEDQATRGAVFELYFGALNETYQTIVATQLVWKGKVDQYKITDAGDQLSVEIAAESRAIDQRRPAIKRFTDEYQQRMHPGDKFFEFVPQMTEVSILWAAAAQDSTSGGSSSAAGGSDGKGYALRMPGIQQ